MCGMPSGRAARAVYLRLSVTRLFNCPNPSESDWFSKTQELMLQSLEDSSGGREREDTSRDTFREGPEVHTVVQGERLETFQLTEPFG